MPDFLVIDLTRFPYGVSSDLFEAQVGELAPPLEPSPSTIMDLRRCFIRAELQAMVHDGLVALNGRYAIGAPTRSCLREANDHFLLKVIETCRLLAIENPDSQQDLRWYGDAIHVKLNISTKQTSEENVPKPPQVRRRHIIAPAFVPKNG